MFKVEYKEKELTLIQFIMGKYRVILLLATLSRKNINIIKILSIYEVRNHSKSSFNNKYLGNIQSYHRTKVAK